MNKTLLAAVMVPLFTHTSFLQAAEVTPAVQGSSLSSNSETVVVTANRYDQSVHHVIASVSVVNKQKIEAMQAQSIPDVLQRLPGVQIIRSGGQGQQVTIFVRGSSTKHLLVLINGVRIGSATTGEADFSHIPLTGVERIELLRGARAAQYGSDAVGGVLNIVTNASVKASQVNLSAGGGSDGYRKLAASAQGSTDNGVWYKFATEVNGADGYSARPEPYQQDDDGYQNHNSYAEIGVHLDEHWQASVQALYHQGMTEFDNGYTDFTSGQFVGYSDSKSDSIQYNLAANVSYQDDQLLSQLTVAYNQDDLDSYDSGSLISAITTKRHLVNWFNHYQLNSVLGLGGGLEWYRDQVINNSASFDKESRDNKAAYISADIVLGDFSVEASVRGDDNDAYGQKATWQTGAAYQFSQALIAFVNVGTAFKAPTFNDLYYPNSGNPDLQPEQSTNYEAGLKGVLASIDWRVSGYHNDVDNLIAWAPDASGNWTPQNVDAARLQGMEVSAGFNTWALRHDVSYDYLDSENTATGKQLIYRAQHSAKWNVSYLMSDWQFDVLTIFNGQSYEDDGNTQQVEAYTLLDVGVTYFVTDNFTLRAKVTNLLDKEYVVKEDYNSQGRSYYLNADYQF